MDGYGLCSRYVGFQGFLVRDAGDPIAPYGDGRWTMHNATHPLRIASYHSSLLVASYLTMSFLPCYLDAMLACVCAGKSCLAKTINLRVIVGVAAVA